MIMLFAAVHESASGTKRTIWDVRFSVDIEGKADTIARLSLAQSDADLQRRHCVIRL